MKRILLLLVSALLLAACVTPPPSAPWTGSWEYRGSQDYERAHPGLGASHRFQSEIGWIDVYVYGLKRGDWADGVADPLFGRVFDSAVAEIRMAEQAGYYREVKLGRVEDVEIGGKAYRHLAMHFSSDGKPLESHLYLTAVNGQLLKFRMSFFAPVPSNLDAVMRDFIARHVPRLLPQGPMRRI